MKYCKNCGIEIEEHRTYCSLKCRNIFVNKNLRDYKKVSKTLKSKTIEDYEKNMKYCLNCGKPIPYEKRRNIYCSHSCSASKNNVKKKGLKYNISDDGLKNLKIAASKTLKIKNIEKYIKDYEKKPSHCINCGKTFKYKFRNRKFCDMNCKKEYYEKNRTEIQQYLKECEFNFSLNDYPEEFDFDLIRKHGWYKAKNHGDNLNGVSRDHMFSRMEGFRQKIDPKIISHPANCQLVCHNDNSSKCDKCSITLEKLLEKINNWNKKYIT